jgi:hypothetical protein
MRCEECRPRIEDYFDGELDEPTAGLMAEHLDVCASCSRLYVKLESEQELYLRYECDAQPAPDFWENVMARAVAQDSDDGNSAHLRRPHRRHHYHHLLRDWLEDTLGNFNARRFSPSLTALMVVAAVGVTVGVMRFVNSSRGTVATESISQNAGERERPASVTPEIVRPESVPEDDKPSGNLSGPGVKEQPLKTRSEKRGRPALSAGNEKTARAGLNRSALGRSPTPDELVREAEQKYVAAIAMLSRDVNRRRSRLDAETIARFEQTLSTIDRTIADTRQAARKHPGDPVAAQYMLTAYARKVDVLREMVGY